jgi:hypothetical protein
MTDWKNCFLLNDSVRRRGEVVFAQWIFFLIFLTLNREKNFRDEAISCLKCKIPFEIRSRMEIG